MNWSLGPASMNCYTQAEWAAHLDAPAKCKREGGIWKVTPGASYCQKHPVPEPTPYPVYKPVPEPFIPVPVPRPMPMPPIVDTSAMIEKNKLLCQINDGQWVKNACQPARMRFGLLKPVAKKRCLAKGFTTQIWGKGTRSEREDCVVRKLTGGPDTCPPGQKLWRGCPLDPGSCIPEDQFPKKPTLAQCKAWGKA
jgi:hypothetical protein